MVNLFNSKARRATGREASQCATSAPASFRVIENRFHEGNLSELEILEAAADILRRRAAHEKFCLNTPDECLVYFRHLLSHYGREHFMVAFLRHDFSIISTEILFIGSKQEFHIDYHTIARRAVALDAVNMVIAHNHPSGYLRPSEADISLTLGLKQHLSWLGITIEDHIIVGNGAAYSMYANGDM